MIPEPGDTNQEVPVNETFHVQTDDELTEKELKQIEADNQAIQTILLGLPEDIYAAVDKGGYELKAERLAEIQDPLALMENSNNPYAFPAPRQDQPSYKQNYVQQPMPNLEDITDSTTAMNMALALMAKAFKLNYSTPTNNNQRISSNPRNRQIAQPGNLNGYNAVQNVRNQVAQNSRVQNIGNQNGLIGVPGNVNQARNGNLVAAHAEGNATGHNGNQIRCYNCRGVGHFSRNCTVRQRRRDAAYLQTQLLIAQKEEAGIQFQAKEFDLMAAATDLDEIEETDKAPIYDSNGSAEVHDYENCDDNEIFNMFTQEEQYTELLEPIPEKHQVPHNDNDVISEEAAKFVGDFKSLAKEADESLAKQKALELEIERLLRAVASQDIMSVVQKTYVVDTLNLQTELERRKNTLKILSLKRRMNMLNFGMIGTKSVTNANMIKFRTIKLTRTCNKRSNGCKLSWEISRIKVLNYARKNAHLKTTYKNLFDSISVSRTQTKTIIASLQKQLHNSIYENAKLRAQLFNKVSDQKDNKRGTSVNTKFAKQSILENLPKVGETHALSKPVTSNSVPTPQESKVMKNDKVIAPGMFRINPSREAKHVPNNVRASARTKSITVSQPPVITKKDVNSDSNESNGKCFNQIKTKKKQKPKVKKPKKVGFIERLATPKPSKSRSLLRWSPTGRMFNLNGKIIASSESESQSDCLNGDNACTSNTLEPKIKQFPNSTYLLGRNDHVAAILGFDDLQWGNILITSVYLVEGLGHKLFSVGQFCDSNLEVAFRRNACFIRNLEGVDLLKGDRSKNIYTINLHEMASASPIYLMAHASSTKSWLWHQHLSHLNFDTINDLARNDLVSGLPKFKYHKEHLCSSCEQGKSKRASHPPKPVSNSRQRLHLLHMDLCGPMRSASINEKRYVLVIVDDYSHYTWSPVIIIRTDNGTEFKNLVLKEYFASVGISHQMSSVQTPQQNGVVERRNRTRKPDISFLHVLGALCYPKNDREDIGKLGAKGDIGFFIGYSADSCAYRIFNRRTKKIMETMNVSFDELLLMAFEQRSSKLGLQSITSGQISSGLDLTYAPSTITTQQPTEGELDLLFEAMYDDYIGGQPSATARTVMATQEP
nr:retrovirus-related Pol polyprotein from transposon TNT 1-94 [Tanacetum cinerariifolium]